jgi:hypothetical protein
VARIDGNGRRRAISAADPDAFAARELLASLS